MFFSVLYMGLSSSSLLASGGYFDSMVGVVRGVDVIIGLTQKIDKLDEIERSSKKGKVLATIAWVFAFAGVSVYAYDIYEERRQRAKRKALVMNAFDELFSNADRKTNTPEAHASARANAL